MEEWDDLEACTNQDLVLSGNCKRSAAEDLNKMRLVDASKEFWGSGVYLFKIKPLEVKNNPLVGFDRRDEAGYGKFRTLIIT